MQKVISYSEASKAGLPKYFTGKPCKFGHIAERRTSNQACTECERIKSAAWKIKNHKKYKESYLKSNKKRYDGMSKEERNERTQYRKSWRSNNREKVRAYVKKWRDANIEKAKTDEKFWYINNREKAYTKYARRHATKINATPLWMTPEHHAAIEDFYREAIRLTAETGVLHEVDHIIPLQGKTVCGLHVPWNLQIITAKENRRKSNKHD